MLVLLDDGLGLAIIGADLDDFPVEDAALWAAFAAALAEIGEASWSVRLI